MRLDHRPQRGRSWRASLRSTMPSEARPPRSRAESRGLPRLALDIVDDDDELLLQRLVIEARRRQAFPSRPARILALRVSSAG